MPTSLGRSGRQRVMRTVAVIVVAAVLWLILRPSTPEPPATAQVRIGDIEQTVLATGKLRPKELVSVGAQVSGQVQRLYVTLGQTVRAGDLIAEIDPRPQQLAFRDAQAAVTALQAQRSSRQAALTQAELAYRRQQTMLAADASARADYEAAQANLSSLRAEMRSLDAQIVQARTQMETAGINLGFTKVSAPMDGVIVAVVTKQGQTVNAFQSAPTIVMLAKLDVMTVRAEISEGDVANVRAGQEVWFTTLGSPDDRHRARIEQIEPAPESITTEAAGAQALGAAGGATASAVYYNALFDVPNEHGRLRPSMTAQVTVLLARERRATLVPVAALGTRDAQGRYNVQVLLADGETETRKVRTGISDDSNAVVLQGLKAGEKVVIATPEVSAQPVVGSGADG